MRLTYLRHVEQASMFSALLQLHARYRWLAPRDSFALPTVTSKTTTSATAVTQRNAPAIIDSLQRTLGQIDEAVAAPAPRASSGASAASPSSVSRSVEPEDDYAAYQRLRAEYAELIASRGSSSVPSAQFNRDQMAKRDLREKSRDALIDTLTATIKALQADILPLDEAVMNVQVLCAKVEALCADLPSQGLAYGSPVGLSLLCG